MTLITVDRVDDHPISFTHDGDVSSTDTHDVERRVTGDLGWYGGEEEPPDGGLKSTESYRSSHGTAGRILNDRYFT